MSADDQYHTVFHKSPWISHHFYIPEMRGKKELDKKGQQKKKKTFKKHVFIGLFSLGSW